MKITSFGVFFLIANVYSAPSSIRESHLKIIRECQKISGLSDAGLNQILKGEITNDPKISLQLQCVAEKTGLQNKQQVPTPPAGFLQQLINRGAEAFGYIVKQCINVFWGPQLDLVDLVQCLYREFPNAITMKPPGNSPFIQQ